MAIPDPSQTTAGDVLDIRVLGPLEVNAAGSPLVVDTRKAPAILAVLAVEQRPFARDELAALLWPDSDDESARGALRRTLSVLRSALGDRWLRIDRSTVALEAAGVVVDLAALEEAMASSDPAALRAAAALARGPFLAGFALRDSPEFDDWRAAHASAADRAVGALLARLVDVATASGDLGAATDAATRLVDHDPLDEAAHRRLMALLARAGDRAGAVRQYRACVAVLERELGVPPLTETTSLYEAIRDARPEPPVAAQDPAPAPASAVHGGPASLPLAGRETELGRLSTAWQASTSDGRLAMVTGEAGIGKTRLLEAVADGVRDGRGVALMARAFPAEQRIAYGPVIELLRAGLALPDAAERLARLPRPVLDELERLLPVPDATDGHARRRPPEDTPGHGPAARARLLAAIADALTTLASGPVPGLVVLEDVHAADDASREAIGWLARRLAGRPLLLAVSWRPEDLDELGFTFAATLEGVPGSLALPLGRLDRAAIASLVDDPARGGPPVDVDALLAESEGLPLYVVEALASGPAGADAPGRTIRMLLRERLASAGETASQVLAAAAVLGRTFDLDLVRGTSGRSEEEVVTALEELVRRALVREVAEGGLVPTFDFAHARLREAAYEATGLARRRLLHRRAAELLRADAARRDDAGHLARIAGHERAAGRDAEAADAYLEAARLARAVHAQRAAADHLETALALGHPDVAAIQAGLGEVRTLLGDYAGAVAALEAAAALSDGDTLRTIELRLGRVHARRGDLSTAASHLHAALAGLDETPGTTGLRAEAEIELAAVALRSGDLEAARAAAGVALDIATAADDDALAGSAHRLIGLVARAGGDLPAARTALERSEALAAASSDVDGALATANALALVEAAIGDHGAAEARLERALATSRAIGDRHLEAAIENNLADVLHAAGRADEAMDHLKQAVTLFAGVGGQPGELEPDIWMLESW